MRNGERLRWIAIEGSQRRQRVLFLGRFQVSPATMLRVMELEKAGKIAALPVPQSATVVEYELKR